MNWRLFGIAGLRDEAKEKVMKADNVPEDVKRFVCSEIDLLPENCRAVKVDACGQAAEHRGHVQAAKGEKLPPTNVTRNCHVSVVGLVL